MSYFRNITPDEKIDMSLDTIIRLSRMDRFGSNNYGSYNNYNNRDRQYNYFRRSRPYRYNSDDTTSRQSNSWSEKGRTRYVPQRMTGQNNWVKNPSSQYWKTLRAQRRRRQHQSSNWRNNSFGEQSSVPPEFEPLTSCVYATGNVTLVKPTVDQTTVSMNERFSNLQSRRETFEEMDNF